MQSGGKRARWVVLVLSLLAVGASSAISASSASALSFGLTWRNDEPAEVEYVARAGASVYHLALDYSATSGGRWERFDNVVEAAWQRGVTVLPGLVRSAGGNRFLLPEDPGWGAWAAWVREAVERYGINGSFWTGKANPTPITAWEVWNEPNLAENNPRIMRSQCEKAGQPWHEDAETCVQPRNYGTFLKWTSEAIQAGALTKTATTTRVLFGGLYMPAGEFFNSFISAAYGVAGVPGSFTGVAIHPYSFVNGPTGSREEIESIRGTLNSLAGVNAKSLWITEMGWPTAGSEGFPPGGHPVSELEQASFLVQSFNWIKGAAAADNIQLLTWFNIQDFPSGAHWDGFSGLRDSFGEYRESWWAYQAEVGAPSWPPITLHFQSLGGSQITDDPDIASVSSGHLNVFARGLDGNLWQKFTTDGGANWSGWQQIGGQIVGGPGAVAMDSERVDVVARLTNNGVGHWWFAGGWHFQELGGEIAGDPDISSAKPGYLNVFARGLDGNLWQKWTTDGGASWSGWQQIGGQIVGGPSAVSWDSVRVDVVARLTNNGVGHWWFDGASWHSDVLGGEIASKPSIASNQQGRLNVFARGLDGNLWQKWWRNDFGAWSSWELVGGPIPGAPGATAWHPNRVDAVARMPDNTVGHWYYSP